MSVWLVLYDPYLVKIAKNYWRCKNIKIHFCSSDGLEKENAKNPRILLSGFWNKILKNRVLSSGVVGKNISRL